MTTNTKQFKNLSTCGFSKYSITEDGKIFQTDKPQKIFKGDEQHRYSLINDNGQRERKTIKELYRKAFNKEFCIDNIKDLPQE
jgi:hypothetical protein